MPEIRQACQLEQQEEQRARDQQLTSMAAQHDAAVQAARDRDQQLISVTAQLAAAERTVHELRADCSRDQEDLFTRWTAKWCRSCGEDSAEALDVCLACLPIRLAEAGLLCGQCRCVLTSREAYKDDVESPYGRPRCAKCLGRADSLPSSQEALDLGNAEADMEEEEEEEADDDSD